MRRRLWLLLVVLMVGCSEQEKLYPLKVGNKWSYNVRNGLGRFVQIVEVTRTLPVAGTTGYQLEGTLGSSRLAWKDGVLLADTLPNLRANPPLPLLVGHGKEASLKWSGSLFSGGQTVKGTAKLVQTPEMLQKAGRKTKTVKTVLDLTLPDRKIQIVTWYEANKGPISQDQVTTKGASEVFDVGMEIITGP